MLTARKVFSCSFAVSATFVLETGIDRVDDLPVEQLGAAQALAASRPRPASACCGSCTPCCRGPRARARSRGRSPSPTLPPRALEDRQHDLLGRARVGGRLEHDQLAGAQVRGHGLGRRDDVGEVRRARLRQRRGHADRERVELGHRGVVGGRAAAGRRAGRSARPARRRGRSGAPAIALDALARSGRCRSRRSRPRRTPSRAAGPRSRARRSRCCASRVAIRSSKARAGGEQASLKGDVERTASGRTPGVHGLRSALRYNTAMSFPDSLARSSRTGRWSGASCRRSRSCCVLTPLVARLAHRIGALDDRRRPPARSRPPVPRIGGLAIVAGIVDAGGDLSSTSTARTSGS